MDARQRSSLRAGVAVATATACSVLSLTHLVWTQTPAVPAAHIPSVGWTVDRFAALPAGTLPPITTAFYSWLAWLLLATAALTSAAAIVRPTRGRANVAIATAALGFVLTVVALKAPVSWADYWSRMSWSRLGVYLYLASFVTFAVVCLAVAPRRTGQFSNRRQDSRISRWAHP